MKYTNCQNGQTAYDQGKSKKYLSGITVPSNVIEEEGAYRIELQVAGVEKKDIEISLKDYLLKIKYNRENSEPTKRFRHGGFERHFQLPKEIDMDAISATYVDGILAITIVKKVDLEKNKVTSIAVE